MKRTKFFTEILPGGYDYDKSGPSEYERAKNAVLEYPFTEEQAREYSERGYDLDILAAKWRENDFARRVALATVSDDVAEPIDSRTVALMRSQKLQSSIGHCPEHWVHGSDDAGHNFAKEIYCGYEYCPICGQKNSAAHLRRFARWLPKVQSVKSIGYFVIEMPMRGRERWHSKSALETAGKLATSVLKGDYEIEQRRAAGEIIHKSAVNKIHSRWFTQGLRRWHYFGDSPEQIGAAVEFEQGVEQLTLSDDFSTTKYNPHLNIIVSAGMIPAEKLERIKSMLRQAFNEPQLIVNYSFTTEPGRMVHLLKYVTRATFLDIHWDKFLAGSLYGFRNMRSWGKWDTDSPEWSLTDLASDAVDEVAGLNIEAINKLGQSFCYIDGLPITWSRPQPISMLHMIQEQQPDKVENLGAGYYRLPDLIIPLNDSCESPEMKLTEQINKYLADYRAEQRCKVPSRHESCLSKTQPGEDDGLVFDSGKPFSQNTDKKASGKAKHFSAGTSVTNSGVSGVSPAADDITPISSKLASQPRLASLQGELLSTDATDTAINRQYPADSR
jgi:hypothetical protein